MESNYGEQQVIPTLKYSSASNQKPSTVIFPTVSAPYLATQRLHPSNRWLPDVDTLSPNIYSGSLGSL